MKNIWFLFVLFTSSFSSNVFGQVGISPFSSLSYKTTGSGGLEKYPVAFGGAVSYNFTKDMGARLQFRSVELWQKNNRNNKVILMRTASIHIYAGKPSEDEPKWMFGPVAGVYAGIGFPMAESRTSLKHPYFGGVFFQINVGFDVSKTVRAAVFLRTEGGGAMLGKSTGFQIRASAGGTLSLGLRFTFHSSVKEEKKEESFVEK